MVLPPQFIVALVTTEIFRLGRMTSSGDSESIVESRKKTFTELRGATITQIFAPLLDN